MNLILFESAELAQPLRREDPRFAHLRDVLRRSPGDSFDCGLIDGPRGKATIAREVPEGWELAFAWGEPPPPPDPITLLVGLPRPQTVRKILHEVTALGVARMIFFAGQRSESSYAQSHVWRAEEIRRCLIAGAEQAFCTRLPTVQLAPNLAAGIAALAPGASRVALDNYEAAAPLSQVMLAGTPVVLAIGAERGWSADERAALRTAGFTLAHLGPRVLRTETACVAGLALVKARLGLL